MAMQGDVQAILDRGVSAGDVVGAVAQVVTGDGLLAAATAGERSADGVEVLRPETVAQMTVNNIGDLRVVALHAAMPEMTNDAEFFPGVEKTWGLTFQINEEPLPTGRPAGGLMWAGIANSYFWIDMDNQVAGTYISQQLPFADARSYQLHTDIETATYSYLSSQ